MDEPASIPSFALFTGTAAASFTALFYLFQRHIGGIPLLAYEPRRRVPWGPAIALVAILIPLAGIVASIIGTSSEPVRSNVVEEHEIIDSEAAESDTEPSSFIFNGLFTSTVMLGFVAAVGFIAHDFFGADDHDLGLPETREQFASDVGLGVFACIASILPIYATMYVLDKLLLPETEHPLIDELQQTHTPAMMLVGLLMVVVAAPLFEEFSFRLLLQGWLEKWEDETIGYSGSMRPAPPAPAVSEIDDSIDDGAEDAVLMAIPQEPVPMPRGGVLRDLPHGWLPILISATFFGLAHWGHGVSPMPLVLFGIVLGYLYQRTHRLVPSITAHALFNLYSMVMLWLSFG
jgi:membrane protease YdiL (CAAX protease family)